MPNKEVKVGDDWYLDENNNGDLIFYNTRKDEVVKAIDVITGAEDKKSKKLGNIGQLGVPGFISGNEEEGYSLNNQLSADIAQKIRGMPFTSIYRPRRNPIIMFGSFGDWDYSRVSSPTAIIVGSEVWIYYEGCSETGDPRGRDWQVGLAKSTDNGRSFSKYVSNPVLSPGSTSSWEELSVADPAVDYDGTDFVMAYIGQTDAIDRKMGIATSTNGEDWTKHTSNPMFNIPDSGVFDTDLVKSGSNYYFYMHYNGDVNLWTAPESDLSNWTDQGTVFTPSESWTTSVRSPQIYIENGTWYMLYGDNDKNYMGLATSEDGQNWTPYPLNPIQNSDATSWEQNTIQDPHPIKTNQGDRIVFYSDGANHGASIGVMREDLASFYHPPQRISMTQFITEGGSSQSIPDSTSTVIEMDNIVCDNKKGFELSNNKFVAKEEGFYLIGGGITISSVDDGDSMIVGFYKNGSWVSKLGRGYASSANANIGAYNAVPLTLDRGDIVQLVGYLSSPSGSHSISSGTREKLFWGIRFT